MGRQGGGWLGKKDKVNKQQQRAEREIKEIMEKDPIIKL